MTSSVAATVHASAVRVGERAVLIRGPSGAGKSRLAFDLIVAGRAGQIPEAVLVGDDRVHLEFRDGRLLMGHVGDSRAYRLRAGRLAQITHDHSLLQEQIDSGLITAEQAAFSANKNLVTRAVGVEDTVLLETHLHDVLPGDTYLLCSDGLSDMVPDEEIGLTLETLGGNLNLAAQQLVQMANDNGGRDNVSVLLIKIHKEYPAAKGLFGKFLGWFK